MIKITKLKQTSEFSPSQWEGYTADGKTIYIRYRWGRLSIRVSFGKSDDIMDAVKGLEILSRHMGDMFDGYLSMAELIYITRDIIEFPEEIENE